MPHPISTTVSPGLRLSAAIACLRHPDMLKPNQAKASNNLTARLYLGARCWYVSTTSFLLFELFVMAVLLWIAAWVEEVNTLERPNDRVHLPPGQQDSYRLQVLMQAYDL